MRQKPDIVDNSVSILNPDFVEVIYSWSDSRLLLASEMNFWKGMALDEFL